MQAVAASDGRQHPEDLAQVGQRLALILGRVLVFWVFAVFPILVLQVAFRYAEQQEVETVITQRHQIHERHLQRLQRLDNDTELVGRNLRQGFRRLSAMSVKDGKAFLAFLERLFPQCFDMYIFDRQGRRMEELSASGFPRRASELAFAAMQKRSRSEALTASEEKMLATIFEVPTLSQFTNSQKQTIQLLPRDRMGALTWDVVSASGSGDIGGFFAVIHPGKIAPDRALRSALRMFNRRSGSLQIGIVNLQDEHFGVYPPELNLREDLRMRIMNALGVYERTVRGPNYHGLLALRSRGGYLLTVSPLPSLFPLWFWRVFNLLCAVWVLVVLTRVLRGQDVFAGKITVRMIGLFLFAVGSPSLVLLFGGYYALRDHSSILMQSLEAQIRSKLLQLDQRLPSEIKRMEKHLTRVMARARGETEAAKRIEIIRTLEKEPWCEQIYLVNQKGECLYSLRDMNDPWFRDRSRFPLMLCREILRKYNKLYEIDAGALMIETTTGLLDQLMGSKDRVNIDQIIAQAGQFIYMSMFDESAFFFIDSLLGSNGTAEQLLLVQVVSAKIESMFMRRYLPDFARQPSYSLRVNAFPEKHFMPDVFLFPEDVERARPIAREVFDTSAMVRKVLASGTEELLVMGFRGQNISKYVLVAQTSLEPVKRQINHLWLTLLTVALLVLLSPLVIGVLLSSQILRPIGHLSEGMVAIQNRQFEHRVPVLTRDELGEMSGLMNQVIEGMGDLQVARIVQESLFPPGALELGGCRITGSSRAMADIGGDYFDYFQIGSDKLNGLIGDVSGHGVSAALIMGMAKCAVTIDESPDRSLVDILSQFNRFLIRTIKRKKMMTGFFFSLDTRTGVLTYANAGHNFPFHYQAAGENVQDLEMASFPLGVRAKAEFKTDALTMQPGDAILLYTDGLIESPGGPSGEGAGYELAREWFKQAAHLPPEGIVEQILTVFDTYTFGRPPADDVTLVCLKRLS